MKKITLTLFVFLLFLACVSTDETTTEESSEEKTGNRIYLAIMDFKILSSEESLQGFAQDIPQTLTQAFLSSGTFKPVERKEMEKAVEELELSLSNLSDLETGLELGKFLGAKYILLGSMMKNGDEAKITWRLIETETTLIFETGTIRGLYENIFDLEEQLARQLEEKFN